MKLLVTGGAGYIGSHTVISLILAGHEVTVIDNLSSGSTSAIDRIEQISGKNIQFIEADIRDHSSLDDLFRAQRFSAVIHFAGLKSPLESISSPLSYFDNNVAGTISLIKAMRKAKVNKLVFSSSASIYGTSASPPCKETDFLDFPQNVYAQTKFTVERILLGLRGDAKEWSVVSLRYFNPIGAHPSGLLGELPNSNPDNLIPHILSVAQGREPALKIFGDDYPTSDGTCRRDFIHIMDLAEGHVAALRYLGNNKGFSAFNLGTGKPVSVLELVATFEQTSGVSIPIVVSDRRPGDIVESWADVSAAKRDLEWSSKYTVEDMCRDVWNWSQLVEDELQH
jgi:UDP-glucose 4-epimerase